MVTIRDPGPPRKIPTKDELVNATHRCKICHLWPEGSRCPFGRHQGPTCPGHP